MENKRFRDVATLILFTALAPLVLFGVFGLIWHDAFHHLTTRMIPFAISTQLFIAAANFLTYAEVKDEVNRLYNYILNLVIAFPAISFMAHSNIPMLDKYKVVYEYETGVFNFIVALLLAEAARLYLKHYEKKYAETEEYEESEEE